MFLSSLVIFILSLLAYAIGLAGKSFPPFFVLHFAVAAVVIPLAWLARGKEIDFNAAPIWAKVVMFALVIVALAGFWGSDHEKGAVTTVDGKLVRVNRGKIIKEVTVADKIAEEADGLKTGAGLWMVFSFAAMIFYRYGEREID
jgi:hypothetical protein